MTDMIRDLGEGLHLKQSTLDDVERLVDYNARWRSLLSCMRDEKIWRYG